MKRLYLKRLRSLLLIVTLLAVPVAGLTGCGSDDVQKRRPGAPNADAAGSDTHPSDIFSPGDTSGVPDSSGNPDTNGSPDATPDTNGSPDATPDALSDTTPDTLQDDTSTPTPSGNTRLGIEIAPGAGLMMSPNLRLSGGIAQPVRRDLGRSTNFRLKAHSTTLSAPDVP